MDRLTSGGNGLRLRLLVEGNALLELLIAAGRLHVLNAHMDALLNDATSDLLVDNDTYCTLGDVPHLSSAPVIVPIRHTLVDCAVGNNVHMISNLVGGKVRRHRRETILSERFLEQIASVTPNTSCLTATHSAAKTIFGPFSKQTQSRKGNDRYANSDKNINDLDAEKTCCYETTTNHNQKPLPCARALKIFFSEFGPVPGSRGRNEY